TSFGPSTVGALNLISGQTGNGQLATRFAKGQVATFMPVTVTGDPDPALDDCGADAGGTATGKGTVQMTSRNIGDLLNQKGRHLGLVSRRFCSNLGGRGQSGRLDTNARDLQYFTHPASIRHSTRPGCSESDDQPRCRYPHLNARLRTPP